MLPIFVVVAAFPWMGWVQWWQLAVQIALLVAVMGFALWRLSVRVTQPFEQINALAKELAGCQLNGRLPALLQRHHPMGLLMERLHQVHINLRAVVGDARHENNSFTHLSHSISAGASNLAQRTDGGGVSADHP